MFFFSFVQLWLYSALFSSFGCVFFSFSSSLPFSSTHSIHCACACAHLCVPFSQKRGFSSSSDFNLSFFCLSNGIHAICFSFVLFITNNAMHALAKYYRIVFGFPYIDLFFFSCLLLCFFGCLNVDALVVDFVFLLFFLIISFRSSTKSEPKKEEKKTNKYVYKRFMFAFVQFMKLV